MTQLVDAAPGTRLIEGGVTDTLCRECGTVRSPHRDVAMLGPVAEGSVIAFICPECGFVATYVATLQIIDNFWSHPRPNLSGTRLSPALRERLRSAAKTRVRAVRLVLEAATGDREAPA